MAVSDGNEMANDCVERVEREGCEWGRRMSVLHFNVLVIITDRFSISNNLMKWFVSLIYYYQQILYR